MDAKRTGSKSWERLVRLGKWCERTWAECAEDGRVRYAMGGLGLGLLVGSLLSAVGDNTAAMYWSGWRVAQLAFLGLIVGLCLSLMASISASSSDEDWESRRRRVSARICTKAIVDPEFREQFNVDWRRTIERVFDTTVPNDLELTVLQQTPKHLYVVLVGAGAVRGSAWAERSEDGRIQFALAGLGLGLLVGSLLSIVGDNTGLINWTSFGPGPISFLSAVFGLCLFVAVLIPGSDYDWSWERRPKWARRVRHLIAKADKRPEFREQLKAEPRRTFERELGLTLSDDFEITVLEETPKHEYIVLPIEALA